MNLFIDESGSFVYTPKPNSWSLVGCYAISDRDYNRAQGILRKLKKNYGFNKNDELKLHNLDEDAFFDFLMKLNDLESTFHVVATESSLNTPDEVKTHQVIQGNMIIQHIDKMKYEEGRQAVKSLRERVINLSPQLYAQLSCQIGLMFKVVNTIVPYYIQRDPRVLSRFRWRVDRKNINKTTFEEAFEILSPAIIQTRSFTDPLIMIIGCDYSALEKYIYTKETAPKYLSEQYGLNAADGLNIQKIIREDIKFVDSRSVVGVQITDLLVSGLRKCLRLEFSGNKKIAIVLGKLMVQAKHNKSPIDLICFSRNVKPIDEVSELVKLMINYCRPLINEI